MRRSALLVPLVLTVSVAMSACTSTSNVSHTSPQSSPPTSSTASLTVTDEGNGWFKRSDGATKPPPNYTSGCPLTDPPPKADKDGFYSPMEWAKFGC